MTQTSQGASGALADATIHEQWVAAYRTPEAQGFYVLAFDEVVRRLAAPPGAVILDAGCGSCAKSVLLAARGLNVVGMDFAPDALAMAAENLRRHGLTDRVQLKQGDLLAMPFPDGSFPYAICWGVLMHVPNVEGALSELARVVAPGGLLVTSEANMHSLQSRAMRVARRVLGRGRGRLERTPAGLVNHETTAHGELVTRETDVAWYVAELDRLGFDLEARLPGQFTELYVVAPWKPLRRLIHAFNHFWFRWVRWAPPAVANLLVFRKRA